MPHDTQPRGVEDARGAAPGLKWPGLTTAQSLAVASQFGVSLAVGVGLGLVAGQWLDGVAILAPLFTLIGVLAGLILGISSVVALYRATLRSSEREWRGGSHSRRPDPRDMAGGWPPACLLPGAYANIAIAAWSAPPVGSDAWIVPALAQPGRRIASVSSPRTR